MLRLVTVSLGLAQQVEKVGIITRLLGITQMGTLTYLAQESIWGLPC
jgi:hypothetical protein